MCIKELFQVKFILVLSLLISSYFTLHGQNFFEEQLDRFFPNRKSKQIERLHLKTDSLRRANDSLTSSVNVAAEKISYLKKEIVTLKGDIFKEKENALSSKMFFEQEISKLLDSISRVNFTLITCSEETSVSANGKSTTIVNTCNWRHYKLIEKGTPDSQGRYKWKSEIYDVKSNIPSKLSNADLFKLDRIAELEKIINKRFEDDFMVFKADSPNCFHKKLFEPIPLSKMRIALNDNSEMIFEADFNLSDACFSISTSSTSFKINELREFIAQ